LAVGYFWGHQQGGPKNWHTLFCTPQLHQIGILTDIQTYSLSELG